MVGRFTTFCLLVEMTFLAFISNEDVWEKGGIFILRGTHPLTHYAACEGWVQAGKDKGRHWITEPMSKQCNLREGLCFKGPIRGRAQRDGQKWSGKRIWRQVGIWAQLWWWGEARMLLGHHTDMVLEGCKDQHCSNGQSKEHKGLCRNNRRPGVRFRVCSSPLMNCMIFQKVNQPIWTSNSISLKYTGVVPVRRSRSDNAGDSALGTLTHPVPVSILTSEHPGWLLQFLG